MWIGEFRLDLHLKSLYRRDERVKITAKPLATLEYLVQNRHRVVSKAELLENVWGGQREISAVEHVIGQLRRALGDSADEARYIETVPGQGYRLVAEVRAAAAVDTIQPAPIVEAAGADAAAQARGQNLRRFRLAWVAFGAVALSGAFIGVIVLFRYLPNPVVRRASINGRTLTAIGALGNVLWTSELDSPWMERFPGDDSSWRIQVVDLNGDGLTEVLVAPQTSPDEDQLLCFSSRGRLLWRYRAQIQARFGTWDVPGPWTFWRMLVAPDRGGRSIYLAVDHSIWWPSFLVRVSASGEPRLVFASSGHIRSLGQLRIASGNYILAGGINNEYGQAYLAALRQDGPPTTSPQRAVGKYLCTRGCSSETPYRFILFPRSELNTASEEPYNYAVRIRYRTNGVTVVTDELSRGPMMTAFYDFSQELKPERVAYGDGYQDIHERFEREGRIKHTWEQCPERKAPAILRICDENGNWSTVPVPRAP